MTTVYWIAGAFYLFAVTWIFYLAVMNLKRNQDKLTLAAKLIAYPVVLLGVVSDGLFNLLLGTVLFIEIPREWMFTHRLERHIRHSTGYRQRFAMWFCINLLDPFDPAGEHCKRR